ncbi:MAG: hypothetical protein WB784_01430 [Rhodanobacteraceae bacterium]
MPPADFARLKADWGKQARAKPVSDEDRNKFAETMRKLTAPDAETTIYAEIEPKLKEFDAQYQKQLPMYVGMGRGWLTGMVQQSKDLSDSDKVQALAAINAIADWVQKTRFTDPALVKQALAIVCTTARELDLKTLDQARALDFDQSMQKMHTGFMGLKDLLTVYGFSLDDTLDSIKPTVVSNDGKTAKVNVAYTLLGAPLSADTEMVQINGHWYGKDTFKTLQAMNESPAPATAEHNENSTAAERVKNQVAADAVEQYEIVKKSGSAMDLCVQAGMVAAAFLQAKNESQYRVWINKKKEDCAAAGLPAS